MKIEGLKPEELMPLAYTFILMLAVAFVFIIFTPVKIREGLTLIFSLWFNLILPGYCILLKFDMDSLERVILGIPVSASLLVLLLYSINIFGMKVSRVNIALVVILLTVTGIMLKIKEVKKNG